MSGVMVDCKTNMREKHTQQGPNWEDNKLESRNQQKCWLVSEHSVKFVRLFLREANRQCAQCFTIGVNTSNCQELG